MLTFFPRYFSTRAIMAYIITLIMVSAVFMNYAMPFQFVLFGMVSVIAFFLLATKMTMTWQRFSPHQFVKKLFITALMIRLVYVVFIYFYYIQMTGMPHMYNAGDALQYHTNASFWKLLGFEEFRQYIAYYVGLSDSGYPYWLGFEYLIMGVNVLPPRLVKCVIDAFSCVLVYNLAKRSFSEPAGRIAAVFCMLMPNMLFYCGETLKETEMAFLTLLFVERGDLALRSPKLSIKELIVPLVVILVMFTFRTAMAGVLIAAMFGALILTSKRQLKGWQKFLYCSIFAAWMFLVVGAEMLQEAQMLWQSRAENQSVGYEWRANRANGNTFAKYAGASVFAPLIFTIPFSSMVAIQNQENQMMLNGGNFIKNVLSGLTILALFLLLMRGDWRKHVLLISVTCGYLVVLVFSNFAHSERFHFPILSLELILAAYGVTQLTNKHKRWYTMWLVGVCIANFVWAWIKLAGRGFVS